MNLYCAHVCYNEVKLLIRQPVLFLCYILYRPHSRKEITFSFLRGLTCISMILESFWVSYFCASIFKKSTRKYRKIDSKVFARDFDDLLQKHITCSSVKVIEIFFLQPRIVYCGHSFTSIFVCPICYLPGGRSVWEKTFARGHK